MKASTNLEHCRREMNDLKKSVAEIIPMSVSDEQVKDSSFVCIRGCKYETVGTILQTLVCYYIMY